ncbi:hypothetical protein ACTFIW_000914 [Dictyostelium discoideum]
MRPKGHLSLTFRYKSVYPATFQRCMDELLSCNLRKTAIVFIDDFTKNICMKSLNYGTTFSQIPCNHLNMFPKVLRTFQEVLTKQALESIPIQIQQLWKLGLFNFPISPSVIQYSAI